MPGITKSSQRFFMRRLYAGMLKTIVLYHRNDDQLEGTVASFTLYGCRRSKTHKGGEPLAGDMAARHYTTWHIPREELDRVGISYINAGDRIAETSTSPTETRLWQIESTNNLRDQLLRDHLCLECLLINTANTLGAFGSAPTQNTAYVD